MNQENFTTSDVFKFSPDVEFLQILARGSLKQNLPKAVRLWVILRSIYGPETDPIKVKLTDKFTYNDWCERFLQNLSITKMIKFLSTTTLNVLVLKQLLIGYLNQL